MVNKRKKLSFILYKLIYAINKISMKLINYNFLIYFPEFIIENSYKNLKILDKTLKFFIPNEIVKWRIDDYFAKEPETLEWIDSFSSEKNKIFWDIGANIGIYSIYAAIKHENIEIFSFESATSNLRTLTRNISINKLDKKIKVVPFSLSNKENKFLSMKESFFSEGESHNTYGENFDFEGKKINSINNKYSIYGTSINFLLREKILSVPDYIKIDVDGTEHIILQGANEFLNNKKIKNIAVEVNENFTEQYSNILKIMHDFNFSLVHKKNTEAYKRQYANTYNYLFKRS